MDTLAFAMMRLFTLPIVLLPHKLLVPIGNFIGFLGYHLSPSYRKRILNNLGIAKNLELSEVDMHRICLESFQNLAITSLEYFQLPLMGKEVTKIIHANNREAFHKVMKEGKGAILLGGHQANWELLVIETSQHYPGVCIGKPVNNPKLYDWVLKFRSLFGAKVIEPKAALGEGLAALKEGKFMGIVGDQALPESSYSYPLFGTRAWSSSAPALLAFKAQCPIIIMTIHRVKDEYFIRYSDPIYPQPENGLKKEVKRLMDLSYHALENSIQEYPGQWFWHHNRWKQVGVNHVIKKYRHDFIRIIMPEDPEEFDKVQSAFTTFREIYPKAFFTICCEKDQDVAFEGAKTTDHFLERDWSTQIVFNFSKKSELKKHYLALGCFVFLGRDQILSDDIPENLRKLLCRD